MLVANLAGALIALLISYALVNGAFPRFGPEVLVTEWMRSGLPPGSHHSGVRGCSGFALPSRAPIDFSDRDRRRSPMFATARKSRPRLRRLRGIHNDRPVGL